MMKSRIGDDKARGERLKILRLAMGFPEQFRWAQALGVSPERWNQVERGKALSGAMTDLLVKQVPGITADWLRYGAIGGLSVEMARLLGGLPPLPLASLPPVPCADASEKVDS